MIKNKTRLPSKLATKEQMLGAHGAQHRSVLNVREDLSTGATTQETLEVASRKKSIIPNLRLNETNEFQDELAQRTPVREHKGDPQNSLCHLKMGFGIKDLVFMSKTIGDNSAYAQGGGGNISVKLDQNQMAIKASGYLLKNVTEEDGYCIVDYPKICDYLSHPDEDETIFSTKIKSFAERSEKRPSMETGFHALLGKFVLHTHSVYANLINCSKEGKDICYQLFPKAVWIDYATPGRLLTIKIQEALQSVPDDPNRPLSKLAPDEEIQGAYGPQNRSVLNVREDSRTGATQQLPLGVEFRKRSNVIFLQNHGVIVSGETALEVLNIHEELNNVIQRYFNLGSNSFKNSTQETDIEYMKNNILFPDQAVYTLAGAEILNSLAAKETIAAYNFIYTTITEKGLSNNFLPKEMVDILLEMDSEKYRQNVLKNDLH